MESLVTVGYGVEPGFYGEAMRLLQLRPTRSASSRGEDRSARTQAAPVRRAQFKEKT